MRKVIKILLSITFGISLFVAVGLIIGMEKKSVEREIMPEREIRPFESSEQIMKVPEGICKYEGKEAGCDQLLVFLYRKDDRIQIPAREDIVGLDKVIAVIEGNGGKIVGQIPSLAMIQIEIKTEKKLLYLKSLLKESPYVQLVTFNATAKFIETR